MSDRPPVSRRSVRVLVARYENDAELEEKDERQHSGQTAAPDGGRHGHTRHPIPAVPRDSQEHASEGDNQEEEPHSPTKLGLAFILNGQRDTRHTSDAGIKQVTPSAWGDWIDDTALVPPLVAARPAAAATAAASSSVASPPGHDRKARRRPRSASHGVTMLAASPPMRSPQVPKSEKTMETATVSRRQGRMCKTDGCTNYIVHKGLCCRHGGGKKCSIDGCESSAKHGRKCWKHGGSVNCKVDGCTKKAKAKGLCWGHGGGAKCQTDACTKVAISNGSCWAHGGGKRCIFDGCQKPAYERTHSFCLHHYNELQGADYYEV